MIPPRILRNVAENHEDPRVRDAALATLLLDTSFRTGRRGVSRSLAPMTAAAMPQFVVYDAGEKEVLPGNLLENPAEGSNKAAKRALEGAQATHRYLQEVHGWNSLDGKGMSVISTVHYGKNYSNAFWNGSQIAYGKGDGILFDDSTKDLDIISHELMHGVTQHLGTGVARGLRYEGETGALNESMSDVHASCVKQWLKKETADEANWLIGDEFLKGAGALRSLKAPGEAYNTLFLGKDSQVFRMSAFVNTDEDNGGVHDNSGIPNHAFYLAATKLGGYAFDAPARIWFQAQTQLSYTATFLDLAHRTVSVADATYGAGSRESQAVRFAWESVEVFVRSNPEPAPEPQPPEEKGGCCRIM